ncbi:unnamed protein product [Sphagnum balticum]
MAEVSSELPAVGCNNPHHQKPHSAAVTSSLSSAHHGFPFHPHQSSSFHSLPYPSCILPPPPPSLPPLFNFPHGLLTPHLPAFLLPFFLGKKSFPTQCPQFPCGPPPPLRQEPFLCRHCGAWNNAFFSPPALTSILPPPYYSRTTSFSQPVDGSIPLQSVKFSAAEEEPDLQNFYDQSLQVDFHGVEEAEEGVEEYVEEEDNDEDPQFVLADEWLEFFAKSEARRKEKKRQQKKEAKAARKAARLVNSKPKASNDASLPEDVVCAFETGLLLSSGAEFGAEKLGSIASVSAMNHHQAQQSVNLQEFQDGMERPFLKGIDHSGTEESMLVTTGALSSDYLASTFAEGGCDELESGDCHPLVQEDVAFDETQRPREESTTSVSCSGFEHSVV